ncbi:MAG: T9SS type A sorting domain-containing protein [Flavobacteriales bacterium]|nr:T9SS type A sorting domain-containing protein [Flavobacteriales bacterium]
MPQNGQVYDVDGNYRQDVYFHSVGTYPTIYGMDKGRIAICVPKPDLPTHQEDSLFRIDFQFAGPAVNDPVPVFVEPTARRYNFYEEYTPAGVTGVTGAKRVVYENMYNNIDVHFYSNKWGPKMYVVIRPGGDPNNIRLNWFGHDSLRLDLNGYLDVWFKQQFIKLTQGLAYQQQGNDVIEIPWLANYIIDNGQLQTGFEFGAYDPTLPLILIVRPFNPDPGMLGGGGPQVPEWCTFVAGAHHDQMLDITHDPEGNIYVTGASRSASGLPITPGDFQFMNQGASDVVVGKFNEFYEIEDGAGWMTYIGGVTEDRGVALAYDEVNARVAVTGSTLSGTSPPNLALASNPNSYASMGSPPSAQFIAWLQESDGFLTYFTRTQGSITSDYEGDIAVDDVGNTYMVGHGDFIDPLSEGAANPPGAYVQWNNPGTPFPGQLWPKQGFAMRLDPQANLTWYTGLGGPRNEFVNGCAVDLTNGLLYVVGSTATPNDPNQSFNCSPLASQYEFPLCEYPDGYFQNKLNGTAVVSDPPQTPEDGFIMRFKLGDMGLDWCSYVGGAFQDGIWDVAVDSDGQAYVAGWSDTPQYATNTCSEPLDDGFPKCDASGFFEQVANDRRRFIARFDEDARLTWSTKIGDNTNFNNGGFEPISLAIDREDNVYFHHTSYRIAPTYTAPVPMLAAGGFYINYAHNDAMTTGRSDTYVVKFNSGTVHLYSTYFGGIGSDFARGITAPDDRVYVCGYTYSILNFPTNAPVIPDYQPYLNETPQAIVAQNRADGYIAQLRYDLTIGVEEAAASARSNGLTVYPNPASDAVTVLLPAGFTGSGELRLVDELGRIVEQTTLRQGNSVSIPTDRLATGLYSAVLIQGSQTWHTRMAIMR